MRVRLTAAAATLLVAAAAAMVAGPAFAATRASCPVRATVYGTTGDDIISGTAGADTICTGAGNDVVLGKGGADRIYTGPGNDRITTTGPARASIFAGSGADTITAGPGDELIYSDNPTTGLRDRTDTGTDGNDLVDAGAGSESITAGGGNDLILTGGGGGAKPALTSEFVHAGAGNDVILSDFRNPVGFEEIHGEAGSDLIWPNPIRLNPLGSHAVGGGGKDVVILLNGLPDGAHMGDLGTTATFPLGRLCSVTVPLPTDPRPGDSGKLGCKLPVNVKIPGLVNGLTLGVSIDANGKRKSTVSVQPSAQLATAQAWRDTVRGTFPVETCICDPKLPGWASILGDTVYN
ncbi:calcium-binding protein [Actinoplanes sp. URMC 104]|uniref:calcium-binding protein n=1 Tax=Actinoplanes sp. URMC 104 TaxID=3423409 RepID=UPI003F1E0B45